MRYLIFTGYFLFCFSLCSAQEVAEKDIDSLYREDQLYAGITYNLLSQKPIAVAQSGFSFGFHFGFIRDIPINKVRNKAFGIGLGYSTNGYNQNILIARDDSGKFTYNLLADSDTYSKNKINTHIIEVPIQFRWRTSTPSDYSFWRIYAGFKVGYVVSHVTKYKGDLGEIKHYGNNDFNDFQYGLTLSAGYSTWNLHVYYGLNSILSDNARLNDAPIDMSAIKLGLMFYML